MEFSHNLDHYPILPQSYFEEAEQATFVYNETAYVIGAPSSFNLTRFMRRLNKTFRCAAYYMYTPPNTCYSWHADTSRACAINWVLKAGPNSKTYYRTPEQHEVERNVHYDLHEVLYVPNKPTILDVKKTHMVMNPDDSPRIILTVGFEDSYQDVKKHLVDLHLESY